MCRRYLDIIEYYSEAPLSMETFVRSTTQEPVLKPLTGLSVFRKNKDACAYGDQQTASCSLLIYDPTISSHCIV